MKKKKNLFSVFYDKEADILYISHGKPSSRDESIEMEDEVVVRKDPKTGEVRGLTILHFLRRSLGRSSYITLPFQVALK